MWMYCIWYVLCIVGVVTEVPVWQCGAVEWTVVLVWRTPQDSMRKAASRPSRWPAVCAKTQKCASRVCGVELSALPPLLWRQGFKKPEKSKKGPFPSLSAWEQYSMHTYAFKQSCVIV